MRRAFGSLAVVAALSLTAVSTAHGARQNDYPTDAIADYVFGCMAANGQTHQMLEKCSCSIDLIASILPYDRYVEAETVLRMRQISGEKSAIFKTEPHLRAAVADLKRAQAESEIRCF
jgi:succinate dehydrogenase/fumarate reductase flavoprotein subunit